VHGGNQKVTVYDLETKNEVYSEPLDSIVNAVVFSPFYTELLAVATEDG